MTEQELGKKHGKILDDPFYLDIRRDLGKEREKELIEAIEAINDDRRVLLQILAVGVFILALLILLAFSTGMDSLVGGALTLIIVIGVPLLGLLMTWISIRPREATTRTLFGEKTGRAANVHYYWLKFRARYGFWKAVMIQMVFLPFIMALGMIFLAILISLSD